MVAVAPQRRWRRKDARGQPAMCYRPLRNVKARFHRCGSQGRRRWLLGGGPALPGCYTQGETVEETLSSAVEAIESHLEAMQEEGMPLPSSDAVTIGRVTVDAPF